MTCMQTAHESMQARNFANTSLVDGTYLLLLPGGAEKRVGRSPVQIGQTHVIMCDCHQSN